ncbi:MAG: efflux RND transporter permease subunit [Chloroflexi bacterium]|nr:efflux RND transporter permease subunit [Chloroflexota bacterium]
MRSFFNWLTIIALRFRWLVIVLSALVMVLGVQSWSNMNQELLPPVEFPSSFVTVFAGGMNSTQVSNLYTIPIEEEMAKIDDIVNIESYTNPGILFLNLSNDFGVNRSELDDQIHEAIGRLWLPTRHLKPPTGENGTEFATRLLNDWDGATLTYLAAADPTLLLDLNPETWAALSAETVAAALPIFARQTSFVDENATALQRFVAQSIIPDLLELDDVADASISGGESVDRLMGEMVEATESGAATRSLLLQLDDEAWQIIAEKIGITESLSQGLTESLAAEAVVVPETAPSLPGSWVAAEETRFQTADDLLEIVGFGNSLGQILNDFVRTGEIRGPLGQTNDLDAATIQQMLAIDASFAAAFDEEQLLALPGELLALLPEDIRMPEDTRIRRLLALKELGRDLLGAPGNPVPVDLPNAWRTAVPSLLTFSFEDFPIAIFSITGEAEIPSTDAAAANVPPGQTMVRPSSAEGPELPAIYPALSAAFGLELDTADDLLHIVLPAELAETFGISQLNASQFLNMTALMAGVDFTNTVTAGGDSLNLGALFAAISECSVENQLSPSQAAALTTAGTGVMITCIDEDSLRWLAATDPTFTVSLSEDFYTYLPDVLLALEIPGFAPPVGGNGWETLLSDHSSGNVTTDSLTLIADSPAQALNRIATFSEAPTIPANQIRLLDEITPLALRTLASRNEDFYSTLAEDVLLSFSRESIVALLEDERSLILTADLRSELEAIAAGAPTALESWLAENLAENNEEQQILIEDGPALNEEWQPLADFYGIELDTADDFFRFSDVLGSPAAFMNSIFLGPRAQAVAPGIFGNINLEAMSYIAVNDENFLTDLSAEALSLLSPAVLMELEALSPGITQRSQRVNVQPLASITSVNSQPSLLLTVLKNSDANSVETYHAIEEELEQIQSRYPNIQITVVSEQASYIEESITGVAREGALGAVFTIVVILLFLSDGRWRREPRRLAGIILFAAFTLGIILVTLGNLETANGNVVDAFLASDIVLRVLLIVGAIASVLILVSPGNLPIPAWRSTLVTTISIPLSLMSALAMLHHLPNFVHDLLQPLGDGALITFILKLFPRDVTLNIMVLSGLTVAIGRVVDDSIVVLENIFRQMQVSKVSKREAIITGTRDVSSAIFTATFVAVVVFLPLGLTGGLISEFFLPFGIAVTYALAASFVVAIIVVPVLASIFIREEDIIGENAGPIADAVLKIYLPFLRWGLLRWRNVAVIIAGAIVSMFIGFALFGMRPFAFIPDLGEPQITMQIQMPNETSILTMNDNVQQLEEFIKSQDGWSNDEPGETSEVRELLSEVGNIGGNEAAIGVSNISGNTANLTLTMNSLEAQERWLTILRDESGQFFLGAASAAANTETIDHCDVEAAEAAPLTVGAGSAATDITVTATSAGGEGVGGFQMIMSGSTASLERLNACVIQTLASIDGLVNVSSNIALSDASDPENASIIRIDRRPALQFSADLETADSIGVTAQAIQTIEDLPLLQQINEALPAAEKIVVSQGFTSEVQTEGFISVGRSMILALVLVILILIITFGSPVYWLVIIFSVIVAPVGAAIALTITNRVLGIPALIGLLMLIGIVVTNAVVLIDRVQTNRKQRGMDTREALEEAGARRLRPILMTSMATVIALLPLAVGLSEGAIVASEMGTVVIGGVLGSTVLTLVVVPVAYMLFNPAHLFLTRIFRTRRNQD